MNSGKPDNPGSVVVILRLTHTQPRRYIEVATNWGRKKNQKTLGIRVQTWLAKAMMGRKGRQ